MSLETLQKLVKNKILFVILCVMAISLIIIDSGLFDKFFSKYIRHNVVYVGGVELEISDNCYRLGIMEAYLNAILYDKKYLDEIIIKSEVCKEECIMDVREAKTEEVKMIKENRLGIDKKELAWDSIVLLKKFDRPSEKLEKMFFSEKSGLLIFAKNDDVLNCIASFRKID